MATSQTPTVKSTVLGYLTADPDLAGVQITYAEPDTPRKECVFFGDTEIQEAQRTNRKRSEQIQLDLWVSVLRENNNAQQCEERMWTLVAQVEEAISSNRRVGTPGTVLDCEVAGKTGHNYRTDRGRVSECRIRLNCHTNI